MDYEYLIFDVEDKVATITLNRPERLNALNTPMRHEMYDAMVQSEQREDIRAVVITGAGRGFCSGGDVKAMDEANRAERTGPSSAALAEKVAPIRDRVVLAMRGISKPVIAAVNGAAAGAGMNIALAADIRIAAETARFGQTFSRRGLHPDWGGTYFLPRLVGMAKACELIWSGRMIDADEALELGIVSQLTAPDELMPAVLDLASTFAAGPPTVIRLSKRAMYRGMDTSLEEALEFETYAQNICSETADAKEGIRAFVEKREPKFQGF